jgi:hypothetical protein
VGGEGLDVVDELLDEDPWQEQKLHINISHDDVNDIL